MKNNYNKFIEIRQIAYNIFEYIKENPNKPITKEQFKPLVVNPTSDKKVTIGLLRYQFNLNNEEITELMSSSKTNERDFYKIYNKLEKNLDSFFNNEVHELEESGFVSTDMKLDSYEEITEEELTKETIKEYKLDIETFSKLLNAKKAIFSEISNDKEKEYFIISQLEIINYWRSKTPDFVLIEEFINIIEEYKLLSEEKILERKKVLENKIYYIINKEIIDTDEEEDEETEALFQEEYEY